MNSMADGPEHAGRTLLKKVRAIRIGARLLGDLWPEIIHLAVCPGPNTV
jgi:hypothetical protein